MRREIRQCSDCKGHYSDNAEHELKNICPNCGSTLTRVISVEEDELNADYKKR